MREILFRGKTQIPCGKWIYGSLITDYPCCKNEVDETVKFHYIVDGTTKQLKNVSVVPETVGQYTGLTDKNGTKIFEGDIVKCKDHLEAKPFEFQGYIDFKNGSFVIVGDFMTHYRWLDYEVEVIGNIHDNLELLKGGAE